MGTFIVVAGVLAGNFVYQLMQDKPDYDTAFERSYFQLVMALCVLASQYSQ